VEYGLMVALIAAVVVTAVRLIGTNLTSVFNKVANAIWQVSPPCEPVRLVPGPEKPGMRRFGANAADAAPSGRWQ
jgi:hypothetical protein